MIHRQAYKFQLKTSLSSEALLRRFAGCNRFVWNKALAEQKARYERNEKKQTYCAMAADLVAWKAAPETFFLSDAPSQSLQQTLKHLDEAYQRFFKRLAATPRFKKKGEHDSFRLPQGVKLDQTNSRIFLPKLGWIRYRNSRAVQGVIKNVTVSLSAGKWFVSIQTEREVDVPVHPSKSCVGIDVGIARFATLSDGSFIAPADSFRRHEQRLARYQRAMSRKVKFSNNWKKAKARVQQIHHRIACVRRDFLHQASHQISQNHAMIVIEDLQISNMSKSAKGDAETPGRNVRAKSGLNKAILDQGWAEFRRQLDYKAQWQGGEVLAVPPHNTSRTCPACDHVLADNRQTQALFRCVSCGYENNADHVGAINVLRRGMAQLKSEGPDLARIACPASDAAMSPATGTRRSDSVEQFA
jgi:putative transposase